MSVIINGTSGISTDGGSELFGSGSIGGSLTLTSGTANGVTYLNGSKVLTSGSALTFSQSGGTFSTTFNINSLLGAATYKGGVVITEDDAAFTLYGGSGYKLLETQGYSTPSSLKFYASNAEAMRLTSTGLGIGTSPAYKLHVSNYMGLGTQASSGSGAGINMIPSSTLTNWFVGSNYVNPGTFEIIPSTAGGGSTFSTPALVLDSSGNLGLGVTPSAWATIKALQINQASFGGYQNDLYAYANAYYSGGWKYINTAVATGYEQVSGVHRWYTALSGTADDPISFTQAMSLTAGGNLLVGTTSTPSSGSANIVSAYATGGGVQVAHNNSGGGALYVGLGGGGVATYTYTGAVGSESYTERARITSGGEFLLSGLISSVGSYWLQIKNTNSSANGAYMENASGNDRGILVMKHDQAAGATTGAMIVFQNSSGSTVGSITSSNTATAYNLSSDRRLKENIVSADDAGSLIDNIEVVKFDWKVGGHNRYGFIAQDLHVVAPEAVTAGDDGDEIEKVWGVDYSKLVPMLIKEIQSLRARVAALEA